MFLNLTVNICKYPPSVPPSLLQLSSSMASLIRARTSMLKHSLGWTRLLHTIDTDAYVREREEETVAFLREGKNPNLERQRGVFEVKRAGSELFMRVDMPGVSVDDVNVWVEENMIYFTGKRPADSLSGEEGREFAGRFVCRPDHYDLHGLKVVMKSGILRMVVPEKEDE